MGGIIRNIKETTKEMSRKEKLEYIVTYYWYHILGIVVVFSLIVFGIVHFAFPEKNHCSRALVESEDVPCGMGN